MIDQRLLRENPNLISEGLKSRGMDVDLGALQTFCKDLKELEEKTSLSNENDVESSQEGLVSFLAKIPVPLQVAMTRFIEHHPNWDQYRLIQAALAGFLVQNGVDSRPITRLYLDKMFCSNSFRSDC